MNDSTEAATVAATIALNRASFTATDAELRSTLRATAGRYPWYVLSENRPTFELEDVTVAVTFAHAAGTLDVRTDAKLGGGLFRACAWSSWTGSMHGRGRARPGSPNIGNGETWRPGSARGRTLGTISIG